MTLPGRNTSIRRWKEPAFIRHAPGPTLDGVWIPIYVSWCVVLYRMGPGADSREHKHPFLGSFLQNDTSFIPIRCWKMRSFPIDFRVRIPILSYPCCRGYTRGARHGRTQPPEHTRNITRHTTARTRHPRLQRWKKFGSSTALALVEGQPIARHRVVSSQKPGVHENISTPDRMTLPSSQFNAGGRRFLKGVGSRVTTARVVITHLDSPTMRHIIIRHDVHRNDTSRARHTRLLCLQREWGLVFWAVAYGVLAARYDTPRT